MVGSVSGVIEGSFLQAENLVCLEAATGGPMAVPSVLATILTPGFDLLLHGCFPMCEARGRIRGASGKFSFQNCSFADRAWVGLGRPLYLTELGAAQKTPFESQAGKA